MQDFNPWFWMKHFPNKHLLKIFQVSNVCVRNLQTYLSQLFVRNYNPYVMIKHKKRSEPAILLLDIFDINVDTLDQNNKSCLAKQLVGMKKNHI